MTDDQIPSSPLDLFGPGAAFHHVGLAVASIDAAHPGVAKVFDPVQNVTVAFVELHGATVEFIEPGSPQSPVSASLAKGTKLVHLCYSVPDIDSAITAAKTKGLRLIARPVPAVAFNGRRIAWLFHPTYGVFELLEQTKR